MFEEIKNGLIAGDFSVESISGFLDLTSERFYRDSKDCKSGNSQIRTVANSVREGLQKIGNLSLNWKVIFTTIIITTFDLKQNFRAPHLVIGLQRSEVLMTSTSKTMKSGTQLWMLLLTSLTK